MTFKTLLSDINNVALAMESLKNITQFNTGSTIANGQELSDVAIKQYKASIDGLNLSQAQAALSATALNDAQKQQILTSAGLLKNTQAITLEEVKQMASSATLSAQKKEEILATLQGAYSEGQWNTERLEAIASGEGEAATIAQTILAKEAESAENVKNIAGRKALTASLKEELAARIALMASNPVTWIVGITAVSAGLIALQKKFSKSLEECTEDLKNYNSEFENAQSSVKSLESELDTCQTRLAELQKLADNGTISIIEQEEYERLQKTNDELERNLKIEKEKAQLNAIDGAKTADKTVNKTVQSNYVRGDEDSYEGVVLHNKLLRVTPKEELEGSIAEYNRLQEEIDKLNKSYDNGSISSEDYTTQLNSLTDAQTKARTRASEMSDILIECEQSYNNLENTGGKFTITSQQNYDSVKLANQEYSNFLDTINGVNTSFDKLDTGEKAQTLKNKYAQKTLQLENGQGNYTVEDKEISDWIDGLSDDDLSVLATINFSGEQTKESMQEALDYAKAHTEAISDEEPFDISKYKDDIDDFQKKMTELSTAYQGVVNGDLDASDLVDLFQEFPELQNESDNLDRAIKKLSEESLQSLYDKLGENIPTTLKEQLRDIATQATQTVTKLKDAYSSLTTTYDAMYEMQEIMDNGGNLTSSVLSSISGISDELAVSVAEYNAGLITSNQLFDLLKEHYQTDLQNYYNLLVAKNQFNEEFYSNMGLDSAELINSFAEDYGIDLSNCKTYAEAKAEIENQTLGQIEGNWKNYYNAQTHTLTQQYRELAKVAAKNSAFGVPDSQNKELQLANSIWKMSRTYEKASTAYDTALSKRVDANFQKTQRNIKAADEASKNSSENAKKEEVQWKDLLDKEIELEEARFNAGVIDFQEYLKKRSGLIQKYYNEAKITAEEYYSELKDMYEAELAIYDKALSAVTKLLEDEVDKIDKSIDAINKKNDALNEEKEKYDNIISAVEDLFDSETDKINEQIDALEEKNDKLGEEQQKYEDVLSAIDKVYDTQIEAYNKEKDNIQDIIDGLQEENDEREREIALMKARYELERAQNQKTQYVYQDGQMVYKTDESAIRDAKEALDEAEFNKATAELNKQIEEIEKNIEALEKMKEKWQEIANARKEALEYQAGVDMFGDKFTEYILNSGDKDIDDFLEKYNKVLETIDDNTELIKGYNEKIKYYEKLKKNWTDLSSQHEKNINKQLATEKFGAEWEAKVLSGRLEGFESFKNRYLQIQDEVTNNEKLLKDLEEKKTYYEELKEQWSSVSSAYEDGMNKQIAAMILGEDWEKKVLDNRKGVFEDFKNNYINIQHQIANATIDAAQAAINAAQSEAEAMQNSLGNTVGYINTVSDEYKKAAKDMEETTKNLSNQQKVLSKFGTNGRFGTVEKFAKGGVVGESNDPTVKKLAQSMGEDTLVAAKVGERILTPEQSKHFEELVDAKTGATYTPVNIIKKLGRVDMERAMQNMRSAQSNLYSNLVANNNAVNSSAIPNYVKEVNVDQHITLTLPNVTNNAGVEYLQKTLSNMTQKAYQMINKH